MKNISPSQAHCVIQVGLAILALPVYSETYLFPDNQFLERSDGLERQIGVPAKLEKPILTSQDNNVFFPFMSVMKQKEGFIGFFGTIKNSTQYITRTYSPNGINWAGQENLNDLGKIPLMGSVLDEGIEFTPTTERYKLIYWDYGMHVLNSRSLKSLNWQKNPSVLGDADDILTLYKVKDTYVVLYKTVQGGFKGSSPYVKEGHRRCVGMSISKDCIHWENKGIVFKPDKDDEGLTEFYSVGGVRKIGNVYIGFLRVLRDDIKFGIGYTVLAWSYDGFNWNRDRKPFLDRGNSNDWDAAMAWADWHIDIKDSTYIYYGGYTKGHKLDRLTHRHIGLATIPKNRFVGITKGVVKTKPILVKDGIVQLNYKGSIKVRLVKNYGKFSQKSGWISLDGDKLSQSVKFDRKTSVYSVELDLNQAVLYELKTVD